MADFLDEALGVLGAVAPTIATAFGGPLAGQAVRWVEGALGMPQVGDKAAVSQALVGATPDQLLALKKADNDFKAHIADLGVELEKISATDRDSARQREMSVKDWMPSALGILAVLGAIATAWMLFTGQIQGLKDPVVAALIGTVIGYIFNEAKQVYAYYFGSTSESDKKTVLLSKAEPIP